MKITIHGHHLTLPRDIASFLRKHVTKPLARLYDSQAAALTVKFSDGRSRKGGVDQECRLTFHMPGARTLHVESVQDDAHKALLDAAQRLERLVQRQLGKQRTPSRRVDHRPFGRTYRGQATRRGITADGMPATL